MAYAWRLHYRSSAILFTLVGVAMFVLVGRHRRQYAPAARWLPAMFAAGLRRRTGAGQVCSQAF